MGIVIEHFRLVVFNSLLACIPVLLALLVADQKSNMLKVLYGVLWLLFLPNTLYVITDITHLIDDWNKVPLQLKSLFVIEYAILMVVGIVTFIYSVYLIEKELNMLAWKDTKSKRDLSLYIINFLVGFGIVLGRIERLNSWDIIANIPKFFYTFLHTLTSFHLLLLAIFFGLFSNIVYFSFKDLLIHKFEAQNPK